MEGKSAIKDLSGRLMAFEKFDLTGRTALITGAAGLLGFEHAAALLEAGAIVVLTDVDVQGLRQVEKALTAQFVDSRIIAMKMDVTSRDSILDVYRFLSTCGLCVEILVNNAAIDPKVGAKGGPASSSRLESLPLDQWQLQLDVGITGAFLCCQVFGSAMAENPKGGVILNIASDLSVISPDQRLYRVDGIGDEDQPVKPITYSVIKTALIGLTRYVSTYWASRGVRCVALSPGGVFNGQGSDFLARVTSLIPLARMASRDEYRSAIQFLCSDASAYMTGQNIVIDGGRSVL